MTAGIILVSDNIETAGYISKVLEVQNCKVFKAGDEQAVSEMINTGSIDAVFFDCCAVNLDISAMIRKLKSDIQSKDIRLMLLLPDKDINYGLLKYADCCIQRPFDEKLLSAAVSSQLQTRNNICRMVKKNNDLAANLYQLNVLYTAGTQLAGELDKMKLVEILSGALDQSLSLSLCSILVLNSRNEAELIIKSLFPVSKRLENAIKMRSVINYKNLFNTELRVKDIVIKKTSKDRFGSCDLNLLGFDSLMSSINIKNKFYAVIEVFRETDFTQEDAKCFDAASKQVQPLLESAVLYDEMEEKNHQLKKLESLKSEFISIVSHELKTPLASIKSALDIILSGSTGSINDAAGKFLNLAKRNTSRLEAIIKDLLDISKIEAGKMQFDFAKADINKTIQLVKTSLDNLANERSIVINFNPLIKLPPVFIDAQRIEQVLSNLVSNAVKFTPENGAIDISSSIIPAEDIRNNKFFDKPPKHLSSEYVLISVKDTGIGIAEENLHKIFEQFKQIENSLSRKTGGSGLGLSIAKRLIEAHKGFIWLKSEINKGSIFYIALPVMTDKEIFELSLEQDMHKAKQEHSNIALSAFSENASCRKSLIDKILADGIIKKPALSENYKEYSEIKQGRRYFYCYTLDTESFVYDFETRRIKTCISSFQNDYSDCGIKYSSALYPAETDNIDGIKQILKKGRV